MWIKRFGIYGNRRTRENRRKSLKTHENRENRRKGLKTYENRENYRKSLKTQEMQEMQEYRGKLRNLGDTYTKIH